MLSALSSLIWGSEEETNNDVKEKVTISDQLEVENEWIFIKPKDQPKKTHVHFIDDGASTTSESADSVANGMEESWIVTPPQCFNSKRRNRAEMSPMENLLIEHPSMSIYHDKEDTANNNVEGPSTEVAINRHETHRAVAGRLLQLEKRQPLKDLNVKPSERKSSSPKNLKRKNMVYVRSNNPRSNKQYGRMSGKHTGMVGKRGS